MSKRGRYYAQHMQVHYALTAFADDNYSGWQIFDREQLYPGGAVAAIALCVDRRTAFLVRDALNSQQEGGKCGSKQN